MKSTFIDTSFLIALLLADDALHERAIQWQKVCAGPFVTTEYILLEFFDAFAAETLRSLAIETTAILRRSSHEYHSGVDRFDGGRNFSL